MKTAKLKNGLICVSLPMDATKFKNFVGKNDEQYQILGTITVNECSFDCSEYVNILIVSPQTVYQNYKDNWECCFNKLDSFKSMIEAETEFLFENPKPNISNFDFGDKIHNDKIIKEWQQFQSRVIEKLLILKTCQ